MQQVQSVRVQKFNATASNASSTPDEQRAIVELSRPRDQQRLNALIAKIREGIDRLKEFRTALISAAVTGKIDVREEVA